MRYSYLYFSVNSTLVSWTEINFYFIFLLSSKPQYILCFTKGISWWRGFVFQAECFIWKSFKRLKHDRLHEQIYTVCLVFRMIVCVWARVMSRIMSGGVLWIYISTHAWEMNLNLLINVMKKRAGNGCGGTDDGRTHRYAHLHTVKLIIDAIQGSKIINTVFIPLFSPFFVCLFVHSQVNIMYN